MRYGFFVLVAAGAVVLIADAAAGLDRNDTPEQSAASMPASAPAGTFRVDPKDIAGLIKGVRKIARATPQGDRAVVAGLQRVLNQHLRRDAAITLPACGGETTITEDEFMGSASDLVKESRSAFRRAKTTNDPAALVAQELLAVIAQESPSGYGRVSAAAALYEFIDTDAEQRRVFTVDAPVAVESLGRTVHFVLNNAAGGGKDIKAPLWYLRMPGLLLAWLALRATEPSLALARDVDAREVENLKKKLSAAISAARNRNVRKILDAVRASLQEYVDNADMYAARADLKKRLLPWVRGFLAAVNREDKAGVCKYLTAKTIASLERGTKEAPSLRSTIANIPNARKLSLHKLTHCGSRGDKIRFRWFLKIIDGKGATTVKIYDMHGFKVAGGFRIGEK